MSSYASRSALCLLGLLASALPVTAQSQQALINTAVQAAPADLRDGAKVISFDGTNTETLRDGSNELVCLAPDPHASSFSVACYHESMDPYMARGRQLTASGITDANERYRVRWSEADAGTLEMPETPATMYVLYGPMDVWDSNAGAVDGASLRWVVYMPWATPETTGLSPVPVSGAPWIMFPGTAGAHIMIMPELPPGLGGGR